MNKYISIIVLIVYASCNTTLGDMDSLNNSVGDAKTETLHPSTGEPSVPPTEEPSIPPTVPPTPEPPFLSDFPIKHNITEHHIGAQVLKSDTRNLSDKLHNNIMWRDGGNGKSGFSIFLKNDKDFWSASIYTMGRFFTQRIKDGDWHKDTIIEDTPTFLKIRRRDGQEDYLILAEDNLIAFNLFVINPGQLLKEYKKNPSLKVATWAQKPSDYFDQTGQAIYDGHYLSRIIYKKEHYQQKFDNVYIWYKKK